MLPDALELQTHPSIDLATRRIAWSAFAAPTHDTGLALAAGRRPEARLALPNAGGGRSLQSSSRCASRAPRGVRSGWPVRSSSSLVPRATAQLTGRRASAASVASSSASRRGFRGGTTRSAPTGRSLQTSRIAASDTSGDSRPCASPGLSPMNSSSNLSPSAMEAWAKRFAASSSSGASSSLRSDRLHFTSRRPGLGGQEPQRWTDRLVPDPRVPGRAPQRPSSEEL